MSWHILIGPSEIVAYRVNARATLARSGGWPMFHEGPAHDGSLSAVRAGTVGSHPATTKHPKAH